MNRNWRRRERRNRRLHMKGGSNWQSFVWKLRRWLTRSLVLSWIFSLLWNTERLFFLRFWSDNFWRLVMLFFRRYALVFFFIQDNIYLHFMTILYISSWVLLLFFCPLLHDLFLNLLYYTLYMLWLNNFSVSVLTDYTLNRLVWDIFLNFL